MQTVMTINGLHLHRGAREILKDVNLDLAAGEVVGILGPNGAGKSSFLSACCAELPITDGQIRLADQLVHAAKPLQLARTRAVLPQHTGMTFDLPVRDVVAMGAYPFPEMTPAQVEASVAEAIIKTDLQHKVSDSYHAMSGGEQQRTQFARVLVQTLAIVKHQGQATLFLDEPTASLDPRHQVLLMRAVRELAQNNNVGVMIVLHDLNMAAKWCDRLMLLSKGRVAALDKPVNVLTESLLEEVYGLPMLVRQHPDYSDQLIVMVDG